jgi:hypothetical protein
VQTATNAVAYRIDRRLNDAFRAVNRLLARQARVEASADGFYVSAKGTTAQRIEQDIAGLGIDARPIATQPIGTVVLRAPRIGLWDQYGGSMESGWTRWILEQFDFPFERVFAPRLDAGNLRSAYDVLIFPDGAIPAATSGGRGGRGGALPNPADVPAEFRSQIGRVSAQTTGPKIREFLEAGGTVIAIGGSAATLASTLGVPLENHLAVKGTPLARAEYFVPGSIISGAIDVAHPIAAGMNARADFFFDNSPVFRLVPGAPAAGVREIARVDSTTPLRSGWAWGQRYLDGGILAAEVPVGSGRLLLFGPEILQRAQPHGTFKLLFNGIFASVAR